MSKPTIVRSMSEAEWRSIGAEFYGSDVMKWEFLCPNCNLTLSFSKFLSRRSEITGQGWQPYAECIGRYLSDVGCNWASYGLFSGPREILDDAGKHKNYVFYFAKEKA